MKKRGGAPNDHPRRCQARSMHTRQQCNKWALKGSKYCQFHGGRNALARKGYGLTRFYTRELGPTLKQKLEELTDKPHHEQLTLYEELAIARVQAMQALKMAEPALEGKDLKPETRALCFSVLNDAMENVKEMVLAASRIEKEADDKVSIKVLDLFVLQITRAIFRVCGTDNEGLARKIQEEIERTVRLPLHNGTDPNVTIEGVTSTPDMLVREMDDMTAPED